LDGAATVLPLLWFLLWETGKKGTEYISRLAISTLEYGGLSLYFFLRIGRANGCANGVLPVTHNRNTIVA
jgi:hypothetical protein